MTEQQHPNLPTPTSPLAGELVDVDRDGLPDTHHASHPGVLATRPPTEPVPTGPVLNGEPVEDAMPLVAVDDPRLRAVGIRSTAKHPLLPAWVKTRAGRRKMVRWVAGHVAHVSAFHTIRLPVYLLKLAGWTPFGMAKTVAVLTRWAFDAEAAPLRRDAVRRSDIDAYLQLARERRARVRGRLVVWLGVLAAVIVAAMLGWLLLPGYLLTLAVLVLVVVFGWVGAPRDKPVAARAVLVQRYTKLTSDQVDRALKALGIAALSGKGSSITFPEPIQRDGPGWRAEVDLPHGVTVAEVAERRDKLASGLRRPLGCVWPEPATEEHPGRLVLWVGEESLSAQKPAPWPLLKRGSVDLFAPVPFMVDQRGRPVDIELVFTNVLIGAMPRMGKTFTVRQLVLAAALDPYARLRLFELKGTGDLGMCERVAHRYASGAGQDALDECMASLREVYADLETRSETIKRVAKERPDLCPENKVTPDLSRDKRLGLGLEFLVIDECQELFSNKDLREEAERLAEGIIKRGPAMGVILILATQRPDAKSLPKSVSDNMGVRFCLRVMGQEPNDMVLGTSSYKAGIRASTFGAKDKGVGYLVGAFDDPLIGRTYYLDGPTADRIIERALLLRQQAGTLSGHAVGDDPELVDVVEDVRLIAAGETKLATTEILTRLADMRPAYTGWTPEQLAAALRPAGIKSRQVWITDPDSGKQANLKGYLLADFGGVEQPAARR